jgi:Ca2+:H+ antiporter
MSKWLNLLLIFIPVALFLEFTHGNGTLIFATSALSIVPLAGLMSRATEQLAHRLGSTVGGLLNATFGNATELIIAFLALSAGKIEVVKASIVGSILGNLLLVLGVSLLLGGFKFKEQRFSVKIAGTIASLLTISVLALLIPTIFGVTARSVDPAQVVGLDRKLSDAAAVALILLYVGYLIFTLRTHSDRLASVEAVAAHDSAEPGAAGHGAEAATWSLPVAVGVLLAATVAVGFMSELLVSSIDAATASLGLSEFFVGLILLPIIGNAAEMAAAVTFALKNRMELTISIALGASVQIALLVAPLLVLAGLLLGKPLDLVVTPLELVAVSGAVLVVNSVVRDGETNWLEGLMLLAVYVILAFAVFFFPVK